MRIRLKLIFSKLTVNLWYEKFTRYEKLINSYLCIPNLNIGIELSFRAIRAIRAIQKLT